MFSGQLKRQVVPGARSQEGPRLVTSSGQQRSVFKATVADGSKEKARRPAVYIERQPEGEDMLGQVHRSEEDAPGEVPKEDPGGSASMSPCGGLAVNFPHSPLCTPRSPSSDPHPLVRASSPSRSRSWTQQAPTASMRRKPRARRPPTP